MIEAQNLTKDYGTVVAVRDGHARLILRRETVDDLLSLEVR